MFNKKNIFYGIVILLALGSGFLLTKYLVNDLIIKYSTEGTKIITQNPLDIMNILVSGTIIFGLIILIPFILYIFYSYLKDALYEKEKRIINKSLKFIWLPIIGGIFGVLITYFSILPFLLKLMLNYNVENLLGLMMIIKLFLVNGLIMSIIFTIPIIIKILSNLDLITKQKMYLFRKQFYLISVVVIALITPTTDAVTLSSMFIPSVIMYEGSIFLIKK